MKVCKVEWCLDAAVRYGACALHLKYPPKNAAETREKYFFRLRELGVGREYRKTLHTRDVKPVRLFEKDFPEEPNVSRSGWKG